MTGPAITKEALDAIADALIREAQRLDALKRVGKDVPPAKQRGPG